jgi:hypothetical protein
LNRVFEIRTFSPASLFLALPPVKHRVDNGLPPTYCKLCKQKHGAGDQN